MFGESRGESRNAPGCDGLVVGPTREFVAVPAQAIGKIQSAIGVSVRRVSGAVLQAEVGDLIYQGDVIETTADGAVRIAFIDGTAFHLASSARMALNEFACDRNGTASSALFSLARGAFAFIAGKVAKTGSLEIDTPVARIRGNAQGGGFGILTLAALTFSLVEEIQALDLDEDPITFDDLEFGRFTITTYEAVPRVILVERASETIIIHPQGSTYTVERVTNTATRMVELQAVQQSVLSTYNQGQRDTYIQKQQRADNQQPTSTTSEGSSATTVAAKPSDTSPSTTQLATTGIATPQLSSVVPITAIDKPAAPAVTTASLDIPPPVNVAPVNVAPVTAPMTLAAIAQDSGPRIITQAELLARASDADSPSLTAINLTITSGSGTLVNNGNGTWTYTPALGDETSVTFSYAVTDGIAAVSATASLDITAVNDAPRSVR